MVYTVTVTSQGQITIPAAVRRALKLTGSERTISLSLHADTGEVTFRPTVKLSDIKPLKIAKSISQKNLSAWREEMHASRH